VVKVRRGEQPSITEYNEAALWAGINVEPDISGGAADFMRRFCY